MELREHEAEGGEIAVLDGAVFVADQRFAQDIVSGTLHRSQIVE